MINLEGKVKTLFLLKQGTSKVSVTFCKDHFVIGELATVKCEVDNTRCEKGIRCVKLKLRRLIHAGP
jgi:hypothetical protein